MPISIGQRRSERISLYLPLVVRGATPDGALLMLGRKVAVGQSVIVMNPKNWEDCEGKVAYVGEPYAGLARVGIEFIRPAPEFWSINFPPADWKKS